MAASRNAKAILATVIVSAYGDMANIRTAMNRGAFDFVTKPIDFADLETTIVKTLRNLEITRGYQRRQQEAERARAQLSRYFSPSLVDLLAAETGLINLEAQWRDITSMFTDIASFTSLVEGLPADIIGPLMNEYLTGMTEIVFDHGGTLMNIIGDALNVHVRRPNRSAGSRCASGCLRAGAGCLCRGVPRALAGQGRGHRCHAHRYQLRAGAGRQFRGGRFFDYAAYGDTLSIAARLETANKPLGTRICVSDSVVNRIPGFHGRPVGHVTLRGRREALTAHEPLTPERHANPLTGEYHAAYAKAEACDSAALSAFAALLARNSSDGLVSFHLKRLLAGSAGVAMALE